MTDVTFRPIGIVHTKATHDEIRKRGTDAESVVEVYPEFAPALEGLDGYSHIFVLGLFDQLRPEQVGPLQVKPRAHMRHGITFDELPTVGVFALDSPTRPNPIGLSLVPLVEVDGNRLRVSGLDYYDGTPVLDIKPYNPRYSASEYREPPWLRTLRARAAEERQTVRSP
jgi:tRNA-Thr(GGU) m(6)t(6)A37 methyltransferase TsaA